MTESLKSKLQKLLTLSRRGIDGEKVNAATMLQKMLKKHSISISEIDSDIRKTRYYHYTTNESRKIIGQVLFHVLNTDKIYVLRSYKDLSADATDYENVLIKEMIDFHLDNFKREKKKLLNDLSEAYVYKHELFSNQPSKKGSDEPIDWERIQRIISLKNNMEDKSFHKRIERSCK